MLFSAVALTELPLRSNLDDVIGVEAIRFCCGGYYKARKSAVVA